MKHISPVLNQSSFHCPQCGVLALQTWSEHISCHYRGRLANGGEGPTSFTLNNTKIAKCSHCQNSSMWILDKMVYPLTGNVEMPNVDLPEDIKADYYEAMNIVNISPRGAAALLRLAIQKLCVHLGGKGQSINDDIESLVKKGLPSTMQQALDSVRVIGNNAVHPGKIDFNDKAEIAHALFGFVNIICEVLITQPKKIEEFYLNNVPESARKAIQTRDTK